MSFSKSVKLSMNHLLIALAALVCAGCASRDTVCRSVYDGLTRHPIVSSDPAIREPTLEQPTSYDQYKYEREELLNKDNKKVKPQE